MPPKKREKDSESSKNPRMDHIQADHELFLQAFESEYVLTVTKLMLPIALKGNVGLSLALCYVLQDFG